MSSESSFIAQYMPHGGHSWADLGTAPTPDAAQELIDGNEKGWDATAQWSRSLAGRPTAYRIIRRTVIE